METNQSNQCIHSPVDHYHPLRYFLAFLFRRKASLNHLTYSSCGTALKTPKLYAGGFWPSICFLLSLGVTYGLVSLAMKKIWNVVPVIILLAVTLWLVYRIVSSLGLAISKWLPLEETVAEEEEWKRFRAAESGIQTAALHGALLMVWYMAATVPMSALLGLFALVMFIVEVIQHKGKIMWPCLVFLVYAVVSFFVLEKVFPPIVHLNFVLVVLEMVWNLVRRK